MNKKHSAKRIILTAVILLLAALLLVYVTLMFIIPAFETVDPTPVDGASDWMSGLDDSLYLSEVVLPGTHDSAADDVQLAFFSKCQDLSILEQLEAGFRYLDMRLELSGDSFKLMHGFASCKTSGWPLAGSLQLNAVLDQCYRFLDSHPTECILFSAKKEHGDATVEAFETQLDRLISEHSDRWLLTDHIPTVGEARGKLVLLRRYDDAASLGARSGIPFLWTDQNNRSDTELHADSFANGSYTLWVQDRFKYDTDDKWAAFTNALLVGKTSGSELSLHFLSTNGSPSFGHPYRYASQLNAKLLSDTPALSGWVIVDFGSSEIAERIYKTNFTQLR